MRARQLLGGLALLLCLGSLPVSGAHAQKSLDTLRIAWRNGVPGLDPYYHLQRTGLVVAHHVWDTLINRDPETLQLRPQLAVSWRYVEPTILEFELRPGVTFHDGSAFTADDVAYTVNTVLTDPQVAVPSNFSFIEGVERLDDLRVRIRLKRVFPAALEYIAMVLPILPKTYRERVGAGFAANPVGTGPYLVTRTDGAVRIDLERNNAYFAGPKGKPPIRRLVIHQVENAAAELAALADDRADWIWDFSATQLDALNRAPAVQTLRQESMRVGYLNLDAAGRSGEGPLMNLQVRRAVMHAVDRPTLSRRFMPGGRVLDAPCYPTQFGCDQGAAVKYAYDPAKARALLAEAGYPDGFETELVGYVQPAWQSAIQGYLAAVGIRARNLQLPANAVVERSAEGRNPRELGSWGSYSINDASAFLPHFFTGRGQDYARDAEVRRLVLEGGSVADADLRRQAYTAAIRRISEQAYFLPLYTYVTTYAHTRELNFKAYQDELPRFYLSSWR